MTAEPTALVTGAARGVGHATVHALLAAGWRVVAGVRDTTTARAAFEGHPRLAIEALDVTSEQEVTAAVAAAERFAGGALACVVNNAGHAVLGAYEETDLDIVRKMFEVNLLGAARVTRAALPAMRRAGRGVVIFVSSISARQPIPLLSFYQASKAGMSVMAEALAVELRPTGVRVALVEPGAITTDFGRSTVPTGAAADARGPYGELRDQVRAGIGALRTRFPLSAEDLAHVIRSAATDATWPFRTVVGEDARHVDAVRAEGDDEHTQEALLELLGIEWPRRRPPA